MTKAERSFTFVMVLAAMALHLAGCKDRSQPPMSAWKTGTTIIPGTFGWDAETNSLDSSDTADLWWQMASEAERYLVPRNGAAAAIVKHRSYEDITGHYLRRWHMPEERISASDSDGVLSPGAVIAFRTAGGTLGKLRIVGFRPLHDLSFPEASVYTEEQKAGIRNRPNRQQYHLEIEWTLYQPAQDGTTPAP